MVYKVMIFMHDCAVKEEGQRFRYCEGMAASLYPEKEEEMDSESDDNEDDEDEREGCKSR